jgi:cation diffusion facilitator CzcD-associated flavoprotein CzcO
MSTPSIAIVGSGFGGLGTAITLKRMGLESFTVLERGDSVGGTWRDNTYPGAACDIPSQIYSYSFELKPDWSSRFGSQREIKAYLEHCADKYGVRQHIRLGCEVVAAAFDEESARWRVELADGEALEVDVLVCATGQLSRPKVPDLPGGDSFAGCQFHSARWDHGVDLRGRRVAVIGSGASAIQIVPAIADEVASVHIFQRSPNWVVPKHDRTYSRVEQAAYRRFPGLQRLHHNLLWLWYESRFAWPHRSMSLFRRAWEARSRRMIRRQVNGDAALAAAVTPDYPLACNRLLISNDWYPTLTREHVELVASGVERIVPEGVVTADGRTVGVDVIVWATGFTATEFLAPIRVTGRDGRILHEEWADGAEAYLGMAVAGYPNLFMMYGPNTNSIHNTIVFMLECQARYIAGAVEHLAGNETRWVDVRPVVQRAFNADIQRRLGNTVFGAGCSSWYKTPSGKVTAMWPGSWVAYARATRRFDPAVYRQGALPAGAGEAGHALARAA